MARISKETIEKVRSVPILDLARALGDNPKRRGKQYQVFCPNPAHYENTPDTYIEPFKNIFKCFGAGGCGAKGADCIKYFSWHEYGEYDDKHFFSSVTGIAEVMGIPILYEDGSVKKSEKRQYQQRPQVLELEAQSVDVVDKVYRAFLALCPIRKEHALEWVRERKYSKEDILSICLRSVPSMDEWISVYKKMRSKNYPLDRIPGFYQRFIPDIYSPPFPTHLMERDDKRGGYWMWVPSVNSGYFIPIRDEKGRITRLRVRMDSGKTKYIWFSSSHNIEIEKNPLYLRKNGVSSGAPLNIVPPISQFKYWDVGTEISDLVDTSAVIAIEGEHKSFIGAKILKILHIGIPGVGNFYEILPLIKKWGVKKLIIAYDMDTLKRKDDSVKEIKKQKNLFEILKQFAQEVMKICPEVMLWTWNIKDGKGLDDLLLNGKLPVEINLRTNERKKLNLKEIQKQR